MNKNRKGILLTENMELAMKVVRNASGLIISGLVIGDCVDQEAYVILQARPGDIKEDPVLGPGLTKYLRGKHKPYEVEQLIKQHFTRAGIDFESYRERIKLSINNS